MKPELSARSFRARLMRLIYDYNCLLLELQQKANHQRQIRGNAVVAEDSGDTNLLAQLSGENDRLDREITLDLKVLKRLSTMIAGLENVVR